MTEITYEETDRLREEYLRMAARRAFDALVYGDSYGAALILSDYQPHDSGAKRLAEWSVEHRAGRDLLVDAFARLQKLRGGDIEQEYIDEVLRHYFPKDWMDVREASRRLPQGSPKEVK